VGEWVELIEECERNAILIRVTTHGRYYDPRNPRDRRSLLEDAVDSEYESSKVSIRAKRAAAAGALEGWPHGRAG
jgi:DNA invertase Pin-like site-specific DNA recombinase